jgi:hypothetical protein
VRYHLTRISRNKKTGPMPVSTSSRETCPTTCTLQGRGCYADNGPLRLHWDKVTQSGVTFDEFLRQVQALPRSQLWRYGQAGDLPPDTTDVIRLAKANGHRPVIVFTHGRAFQTYREATGLGFHVNLSCDSLKEADALSSEGLSMVVVLPTFYARQKDEALRTYRARIGGRLGLTTPGGRGVAICPATYYETDCSRCQVCAKARAGGTIMGFPAHGSTARRIDFRLNGGSIQHDYEQPRTG